MISQNCIGLLLFIRVIHIHPLPIAGSVNGLGSRMVVSLCLALCVNGCGVLGIIGRSLVIQGEQRLQKVTCRLEGPKLQEGVKRLATRKFA